MYVFEHCQSQKYGKIFLVFRIFRAKVIKKKNAPASLRRHSRLDYDF